MTTYNESKIYKITSDQTPDIYIGSTTQTLNIRLSKHKNDYKRYLKGKYHYVTSFNIVKYPNCKIDLLELCDFETKEELRKRESEYIKNNICVNKCMTGMNLTRRETNKKYRDKYKDKINKKFVCLCGGKYTTYNKMKHMRTKKHHIYKNKKTKDIQNLILMIYKLSNIILYNHNHG